MSAKTRGPACGDRPGECGLGADSATVAQAQTHGGAA